MKITIATQLQVKLDFVTLIQPLLKTMGNMVLKMITENF